MTTAPQRRVRWFFLIGAVLHAASPSGHAYPEIPGEHQSEPMALVGGTIHPVTGPDVEDGVLLFDRGRIVAIGPSGTELPEGTRSIDVAGKHVYPGLIDAHTNLGLIEINAARATRDERETGRINPNVRAQVAINPDSELIPVARSGGILLALSVPKGPLLPGQSALVQLDGWTWEEMTLKAPVAVHLTWPRMRPVESWQIKDSRKKQIEKRDKMLQALDQAFSDARSYLAAQKAHRASGQAHGSVDARWEALRPVLEGALPLVVKADELRQIQAAIELAQREQVRIILSGGYDVPHCIDLVTRHDIPVIVGSVHRLPLRRHDPHDAPFTLPATLAKAGVRFCISGGARFGASTLANLPYHAATAVAHGLDRAEAIRAITIYPARILGVADRVGSLEPDKDATLIVTDGDILEVPTHVDMAFIQGRPVDLSNRHKRLWRKYQQRYK